MRGEVAAAVAVVAILVGAGGGYLLGSTNERTVTSISTVRLTTTVTSTTTFTTTSVTVIGPLVYISASGYCVSGSTLRYVPCWGKGTDAYVFNCTTEAASPQGCTRTVTSTINQRASYIIDIRWPFTNSTAPVWATCFWAVAGAGEGYGYCASFNSTSFVVGQPTNPPFPVG